jgi:hypothetical protein
MILSLRRARPLRAGLPFAAATTALLVACTPALDWRDVRPAGSGLVIQFPCKPAALERKLALAGTPVTLSLSACKAERHTWGLAHADVADPAKVGPALAELLASARGNVGGAAAPVATLAPTPASGVPTAAASALAVPGATPNPQSARVQWSGTLPDGTAVQMHVAVFARGTRVFQATALGAAGDTELLSAAEAFFASMRLAS